jgi:hypothetical protein
MTNSFLTSHTQRVALNSHCLDVYGVSWPALQALAALVTVAAGFPGLPPWLTIQSTADIMGVCVASAGSRLAELERAGMAERVDGCAPLLLRATAKGRRVVGWR